MASTVSLGMYSIANRTCPGMPSIHPLHLYISHHPFNAPIHSQNTSCLAHRHDPLRTCILDLNPRPPYGLHDQHNVVHDPLCLHRGCPRHGNPSMLYPPYAVRLHAPLCRRAGGLLCCTVAYQTHSRLFRAPNPLWLRPLNTKT